MASGYSQQLRISQTKALGSYSVTWSDLSLIQRRAWSSSRGEPGPPADPRPRCSTSIQNTGGKQLSLYMDASKPQTGQTKCLACTPTQQEAPRLLLLCPEHTAEHRQEERDFMTGEGVPPSLGTTQSSCQGMKGTTPAGPLAALQPYRGLGTSPLSLCHQSELCWLLLLR